MYVAIQKLGKGWLRTSSFGMVYHVPRVADIWNAFCASLQKAHIHIEASMSRKRRGGHVEYIGDKAQKKYGLVVTQQDSFHA